MSEIAIQIDSVGKRFGEIRPRSTAPRSRFARGELFGVLGPSGCGKSTLLRVLMGFERPDVGDGDRRRTRVERTGRRMGSAGDVVSIGMVVQDYALFPHLSVLRNVEFGLHRLPRRKRAEVARGALELVGLAAPRRMRTRMNSPAANVSESRWRARSRLNPSWSCSTSRSQAWTHRCERESVAMSSRSCATPARRRFS